MPSLSSASTTENSGRQGSSSNLTAVQSSRFNVEGQIGNWSRFKTFPGVQSRSLTTAPVQDVPPLRSVQPFKLFEYPSGFDVRLIAILRDPFGTEKSGENSACTNAEKCQIASTGKSHRKIAGLRACGCSEDPGVSPDCPSLPALDIRVPRSDRRYVERVSLDKAAAQWSCAFSGKKSPAQHRLLCPDGPRHSRQGFQASFLCLYEP